MIAIPEATTRAAMLERQEADIIYAVPGELINKVKSTRGVMLAGSWSFWYEAQVKCGGFNVRDRLCITELDEKFVRYESSLDPEERQKLAVDIQRNILEHHYLVPVFRHAAVQAIGPRIAAERWQDVFQTITTGYAYPWEDIRLKD